MRIARFKANENDTHLTSPIAEIIANRIVRNDTTYIDALEFINELKLRCPKTVFRIKTSIGFFDVKDTELTNNLTILDSSLKLSVKWECLTSGEELLTVSDTPWASNELYHVVYVPSYHAFVSDNEHDCWSFAEDVGYELEEVFTGEPENV